MFAEISADLDWKILNKIFNGGWLLSKNGKLMHWLAKFRRVKCGLVTVDFAHTA